MTKGSGIVSNEPVSRQNPSFDVNTNYQRALAGLPVNQTPPQIAPAVAPQTQPSLMSPNVQGYQGFGSGLYNYQNPFSLQTPTLNIPGINPMTGRPWGQ